MFKRRWRSKAAPKTGTLRHAGESLDEDIFRQDSELQDLLVAAVLLLVMPIAFAVGKYLPGKHAVFILAAIAFGGCVWIARRLLRIRRRLKNDFVGRDGERIVGQFLEEMRGQGYKVLHAVPFNGGDIDHILIGPTGLFTIETKMRSPRDGWRPEVVYDGKSILVNGLHSDRDPLIQAQRQADWLRALIAKKANKHVDVRPVVWYPESNIEYAHGAKIWVINERLFPKFLEHEEPYLTVNQVEELYASLCEEVRNSGRGH